jgi:hypothetical protein
MNSIRRPHPEQAKDNKKHVADPKNLPRSQQSRVFGSQCLLKTTPDFQELIDHTGPNGTSAHID